MHAMRVMTLGVFMLAGAVSLKASIVSAEDGMKALPTLLIKGEVVSLDTNDPSAVLLKVKDRYGFETPIFVTPETKVSQGEQALTTSNLQSGAAVEVEYSFDINTAKRYAVTVKLPSEAGASSSAPAAAPAATTPAPVTPAPDPAAPEAAAPTTQPVESAPVQ